MSANKFFELVNTLPGLQKQETNYRKSISPMERLAVTLKVLGHGDSIYTTACSYRMGESTVRGIVFETSKLIWETLKDTWMPKPTEETWLRNAERFWTLWNYPNCIGAIDGKHVVFEKPRKSGSLFFNYKKEFSIVLLALVDADYRFITVDVGSYGRNSDGGIFRSSSLGKSLANGTLNIPPPKALPYSEVTVPMVIVGDEAFPLLTNSMRPFPGAYLGDDVPKKIYNYRHSRARRVSENAFGILAKKFRIYGKKFSFQPETMDYIILATTILHNFLRDDKCCWQPGEFEMDAVTEGLGEIPGIGGNNPRDAFEIRDIYMAYFMSEAGSVPWQWQATLSAQRDT
ncbi:uncharacterized protein [Bemisia tabaci]